MTTSDYPNHREIHSISKTVRELTRLAERTGNIERLFEMARPA